MKNCDGKITNRAREPVRSKARRNQAAGFRLITLCNKTEKTTFLDLF